jgi:hypothetical protein
VSCGRYLHLDFALQVLWPLQSPGPFPNSSFFCRKCLPAFSLIIASGRFGRTSFLISSRSLHDLHEELGRDFLSLL